MADMIVIDGTNAEIYEYVKNHSSEITTFITKGPLKVYFNHDNISNRSESGFINFNNTSSTTSMPELITTLKTGTCFTGNLKVIDSKKEILVSGIPIPTDKNKTYLGQDISGNATVMFSYGTSFTRKVEFKVNPGSSSHDIPGTKKCAYAPLVESSHLNISTVNLNELKAFYEMAKKNYSSSKITDDTPFNLNQQEKTNMNTLDNITSNSSSVASTNANSVEPITVDVNEDLLGEYNWTDWDPKILYNDRESYKANSGSLTNDINLYRGIFGMPYQFLPSTDTRINGLKDEDSPDIGTTYNDKIISRLPILFMTPGEATFASINKSKRKEAITQYIMQGRIENAETQLSRLLDGYEGKFYTLNYDFYGYYKYVNPMCRMGAIFLGLHKNDGTYPAEYLKLEGEPLTRYNWAFYGNNSYTGDFSGNEDGGEDNDGFEASSSIRDTINLLYYKSCIPFYINSATQFSESIGNETAESSLSSTINGFSDKARELQFILGTSTNIVASQFDTMGDALQQSREAVEKLVDNISSQNNIFSTLVNSVRTIVSGGRLIFPNIWTNSTFNKSYDINIKLITPDNDPKSWWLNIYVPLCHLLGFVLPKGEYTNGYSSPYLVKAFYKGMFNIDMGIITEMTIQKGKEGSWTKDGLPTVVDVNFTIQDLYSQLSMTPAGKFMRSNTMMNISEMDYLGNLCGVNINQPDLIRMMEMFAILNIEDVFSDIIPDVTIALQQSIDNVLFKGISDNNIVKKGIFFFRNR